MQYMNGAAFGIQEVQRGKSGLQNPAFRSLLQSTSFLEKERKSSWIRLRAWNPTTLSNTYLSTVISPQYVSRDAPLVVVLTLCVVGAVLYMYVCTFRPFSQN